MASYKHLSESEIKAFLSQKRQGTAGVDPVAVTQARSSNNPRAAISAQRQIGREISANNQEAARQAREQEQAQREQEQAAKQQAKEQEQAQREDKARQVRAAESIGVETTTDIDTGRKDIARHPDGSLKYTPGPVGDPQVTPTHHEALSAVPILGSAMETFSRPANHTGAEYSQTYRDDRGNQVTLPLPSSTDEKTGEITQKVPDQYGRTDQKVTVGVDPEIAARRQREEAAKQSIAEANIRKNTVDQAKNRFNPQWQPVKASYLAAEKDAKAFQEKRAESWRKTNVGGVEKWQKFDPATGAAVPFDPREVAMLDQKEKEIQGKLATAKAQYDKLHPTAQNLDRVTRDVRDRQLAAATEAIRAKYNLPEEDGGQAARLARMEGIIDSTPEEDAVNNLTTDEPGAAAPEPQSAPVTPGAPDSMKNGTAQDVTPQPAAQENPGKPVVVTDETKSAFSMLQGLAGASVKDDGAFQSIWRGGRWIATLEKDKAGQPFTTLQQGAHTQEDVMRMVGDSTNTFGGVPLYLAENPDRMTPTTEAEWVAKLSATLDDPALKESPNGLNQAVKALGADRESVSLAVQKGKMSVQTGNLILKSLYGDSMQASGIDEKAFAEWRAKTSKSMDAAVQAKYGKPGLFDQQSPDRRWADANGFWHSAAAKNELRQDFLRDSYLENRGKPGVTRAQYLKAHQQDYADDMAWWGLDNLSSKGTAVLKSLSNDVIASMLGLAAGGVVSLGQAEAALFGVKGAKEQLEKDMKLRNRDFASWSNSAGRNIKAWTTPTGMKAAGEFGNAVSALQSAIDIAEEDPTPENKTRVDEAERRARTAALAMHNLNPDEEWPTTEQDLDPNRDRALGSALAQYKATADPRFMALYRDRMLQGNGRRQYSAEMEAKIGSGTGFFNSMERAMYAGWQELGSEVIADAAAVVTAGGAKALQASLRAGKAVGAASRVGRMQAAVVRGLAAMDEFATFKGGLQKPLSAGQKASNFGVSAVKGMVGEGLEEVAVEVGAESPELLKSFGMGMVGVVGLLPAQMVAASIRSGTLSEKQIQQSNERWAAKYNERMAGTPGFEAIKPEDAAVARYFINSARTAEQTAAVKDLVAELDGQTTADDRAEWRDRKKAIETDLAAGTLTPEQAQAAKGELADLDSKLFKVAGKENMPTREGNARLRKMLNDSLSEVAADVETAVTAARAVAALPDPAQRTRFTAMAKVATGNAHMLTKNERTAIQGSKTRAGADYFETVTLPNGGTIETVTAEGRAELNADFPEVGALVQTPESLAHVFSQPQATNEQNPQGTPGQQAPAQNPQPAPANPNAPGDGGGSGGGVSQATTPGQAPVGTPGATVTSPNGAPVSGNPDHAAMDAAIYTAARQSNPDLPSIPEVVAAARAAGKPVSQSMADEAARDDAEQTQQPATKTPSSREIADRVKSAVESAMPGLSGRINIKETAHPDMETGGALVNSDGTIELVLPDIQNQLDRFSPEDVEASLLQVVREHEVTHIVQYQAVRALWEASGKTVSFNQFFAEFYGKMHDELHPDVFAAARKIYGEKAWDALPSPSIRSAELVRMLVEASRPGADAGRFSELMRALQLKQSPTLIAMLKQAVEMLVEMVRTGKLPESVRAHVEQISALYDQLASPTTEVSDAYAESMTTINEAITAAMEANPAVATNDDMRIAMDDAASGLATIMEGMPAEKRRAFVDSAIADWLEENAENLRQAEQDAAEAAAEKADAGKSQPDARARQKAAREAYKRRLREKARAILNSENYSALSSIFAKGTITPKPRIISLILAKQDNGQKLTQKEIDTIKNVSDWNGMPRKQDWPGGGNNAVIREIIDMIFAPAGKGQMPNVMADKLTQRPPINTASEMFEQIDKELTAISRGKTLIDEDSPEYEGDPEAIAKAEAEQAAAAANQPATLDSLRISTALEFGGEAAVAQKAAILAENWNKFNEQAEAIMTDALLAEIGRIRAGVPSAQAWQEQTGGWSDTLKKVHQAISTHTPESLRKWAESLPVVVEEESPLFSSGPNGRPSIKTADGVTLEAPGIVLFASTAYHGTPHKVDRFSTDKIGTGEGAQAYGWGLYYAENKRVAEGYQKKLSKGYRYDGKAYDEQDRNGKSLIERWMTAKRDSIPFEEFKRKTAEDIHNTVIVARHNLAEAQKNLGKTTTLDGWGELSDYTWTEADLKQAQESYDNIVAMAERVDRLKESDFELNEGNLYTVNLKVEDEDLLDWDGRVAEYDPITKAINKLFREKFGVGGYFQGGSRSGGAFYQSVAKAVATEMGQLEQFGTQTTSNEDKIASQFFLEAGIKGIRYLDGNSRANPFNFDVNVRNGQRETLYFATREEAEYARESRLKSFPNSNPSEIRDGSYNYVIFDENDIEILEENGQPVQPMALFSSPAPFQEVSGLSQSLSKPPNQYEYTQATDPQPALDTFLEQRGLIRHRPTTDLAATRRIEEVSGASIIFVRGQGQQTLGGNNTLLPRVITINAEYRHASVGYGITHELVHVAQKDSKTQARALMRAISGLITPREIIAINAYLEDYGYRNASPEMLASEFQAFLVADAVMGTNYIGLDYLQNAAALRPILRGFFENLPRLNPDNGPRELFSTGQALFSSQPSFDFGATGDMGTKTQRGLDFGSIPEGPNAKFQANTQKAMDAATSEKARENIAATVAKKEGLADPKPFVKAAIGGQASFDFGTTAGFGTKDQLGFDFAGRPVDVNERPLRETQKPLSRTGETQTAPRETTKPTNPPQAAKPGIASQSEGGVMGYSIDSIMRAQQGGRLSAAIPAVDHAKAAEKIMSDVSKFGIPVAKETVETYGLTLPENYQLDGDTYKPAQTIDSAANEAATSPKNDTPEPTEAQKKAGNYKVGRVTVGGMEISIENPAGSTRSGTDKDGEKWEVEMHSHYGYIRGTTGKDGDHIDIFIQQGTPNAYNGPVFVVNQVDENGRFDEHKAVMGASITTPEQAKAEYLSNYSPGWKGAGDIAAFGSVDAFREWATEKRRNGPAKGDAPTLEVFTGTTAEVDSRNPGVRLAIAMGEQGKRFTLWQKVGRRQWDYIRTLPTDRSEALETAKDVARRIASGEGAKMAFYGSKTSIPTDQEVAQGVAVQTDTLTKSELEKSAPPMPIGEQNVGFGKYADVPVSELFKTDPDYTMWLYGSATRGRAGDIKAYLERDPDFLAARDADMAKQQDEADRIRAAEEKMAAKKKAPSMAAPEKAPSMAEIDTAKIPGKKVGTYPEPQYEFTMPDGSRISIFTTKGMAEARRLLAEKLAAKAQTNTPQAPVEKKTQPKLERREAAKQYVSLIDPVEGIADTVPADLQATMFPMQVNGANAAIASLEANGAFLNGDGAGVGKTRQILAVANHYAKQGKRVVIITENAAIGKPWEGKGTPAVGGSMAKDSQAMGIELELMPDDGIAEPGKIRITTYHRVIPTQVTAGTVVIFDESQNLANIYGDISKETGNWKEKFGFIFRMADKVAYYSATPADKPHQLAYLYRVLGFDTPESYIAEAKRHGMITRIRMFGRVEQKSYDVPGSQAGRMKLYRWVNSMMTTAGREGRFIKREISYEGTDIQFQDVVGKDLVGNDWSEHYHAVMEDMSNVLNRNAQILAPRSYELYAAELTKIGKAVDLAKRELAAGRKVVLYFSRIREMEMRARYWTRDMDGSMIPGDPFVFGTIASPVELLKAELQKSGIAFAELHGKSGDTSKTAQTKFSKDVDVLLASVESGGTGINLDDTVGNNPRTEIFMFAPYRGISTIQAMGRIWRASTIQNDNNPNRFAFIVASDISADASRSAVLAKKIQLMNASLGGTAVQKLPMSKVSFDKEQLVGLEIPENDEGSNVETGPLSTNPLKPVNIQWKLAKSGATYWARATADLLEWVAEDGPERTGLGVKVVKKPDGYLAFADADYQPEDFAQDGGGASLFSSAPLGGQGFFDFGTESSFDTKKQLGFVFGKEEVKKAEQEQETPTPPTDPEPEGVSPQPGQPEFKLLPQEVKTEIAKDAAARAKAKREGIDDFGEKIGGARKDLAQKSDSPKSKRKTSDQPGWFTRYEVFEVVAEVPANSALERYWMNSASARKENTEVGRFIIRDLRKLDWKGNPERATRQSFATREEAELHIPIIEVTRNHRVRSEKVEGVGPTGEQISARVKADSDEIQAIRDSEAGQLLTRLDLSNRFRNSLAKGEIDQARFEKLQKEGYILTPEEEEMAADAQRRIDKIRNFQWPTGSYRYGIWREVSDRKRVQVVAQTFDSEEEAKRYMVAHAVEIIETKTSWREELIVKPERPVRKGPERRNRPATPEMFQEAFGFRGVEFGNWMRQAGDGKERQEVLNHAYDGLLDMAEIIGVPARALSLNGELGLAFGARGQGLSGAKAHYEPDFVVINLTKMSGAGSLAHEWIHALDHYFARQDGRASSAWNTFKDGTKRLKPGKPEEFMASHGFSRKDSKVREEVRNAFMRLMDTIFNKAVEYVEDSENAERFVNKSRTDLEKEIADIRKNFTREPDQRYEKRRKVATEAQLAVFDSITNQFIAGSDLETDWRMVETKSKYGAARWTNDALEKLNMLHKEITGRAGFNKDGGPLDYLRTRMKHYDQRLKMLASAQATETKVRKVPTDFSMNARRIDQGSASDYWNTNHEMLARAFSAYIEDRVSATGGSSDFLSYGSDNRLPQYVFFNLKPFPEGSEREVINKAFDSLFDAIESRETEKGIELFSSPSPGDPFTREKAEILKTAPRGSDGHPLAPNGQRSNLTEDQWATVRTKNFRRWFGDWLGLEINRVLNGKPLTDIPTTEAPTGAFSDLRAWAIGVLEKQGGMATNPLIGEVVLNKASVRDSLAHGGADKFKRAAFLVVKDVIERGALVHSAADSEKISHYISAPVIMDGRRQIVTVLIRKHPQSQRMYLHSVTAQESLRTPRVSGAGNQLASSTDAEGIWNILHDSLAVNPENVSKIVDENGEPMVTYHGTSAEDFDTFQMSEFGKTDGGWYGEGFYFSGKRETAESYARASSERSKRPKRIIEAFLNIRHPYETDRVGEQPREDERGDGILFYDYLPGSRAAYETPEEIVAYLSNQIKSATDNNGDFSESASMLLSSPAPASVYSYQYRKETSRGEVRHIVATYNEKTGKPENRTFDTYAEAKEEMDRLDDLASPVDPEDVWKYLGPNALYSSPAQQADLFAAANAPDAQESLGKVKVGTMNALGAYRALTAKREAGKTLTAKEEQQLLDAEQALGQKLAFDMDSVKGTASAAAAQPATASQPLVFGGPRGRTVQDEMPRTGEIDRNGQINLLSSPAPDPVQAALDKMPPVYGEVFRAVQSGATPEEVMAKHNLTARAVTNILNQVRSRVVIAKRAAAGTLQAETNADGQFINGRPDLAEGANPDFVAVDQIRNESDIPDAVTMAEHYAEADRRLAANYEGEFSRIEDMARTGQRPSAVDIAIAKQIFRREALSGGLDDPQRRMRVALFRVSYREQGTEQALAFQMRRDEALSPAERNALHLTELLFEPSPEVQARMKGADAQTRDSILKKWMEQIDAFKAEMKAEGLDVEASLAAWHARKQAIEKAEAVHTGTKAAMDQAMMKLSAREKTVIRLIRDGAKLSTVMRQTGMTKEQVMDVKHRFGMSWREAIMDAGRRFAQNSLASSPAEDIYGRVMNDLGWQSDEDFDDTAPDYLEKQNEKRKEAKKRERAKKNLPEQAPKVKNLTPKQQAELDAAWERFKAAPQSTWTTFWQTESKRLSPILGAVGFADFQGQALQPWRDLWQTEMAGISTPESRMSFEEWLQRPQSTWTSTRTGTFEAFREPINETRGTFDVNDPSVMSHLVNEWARRNGTWINKFTEFYKMSILSGPQTMLVNASGGLFVGYDLTVKRAAEAAWNGLMGMFGAGDVRSATFSEFLPMLKNVRAAMKLASRNALESWKLQSPVFDSYASAKPIQLDFTGVGPEYAPPATTSAISRFLRNITFRELTAVDEFWKGMFAQMDVAALAHRIAAKEENLSGKEYAARVEELMKPGSLAWQRSIARTKRVTFQDPLAYGKWTAEDEKKNPAHKEGMPMTWQQALKKSETESAWTILDAIAAKAMEARKTPFFGPLLHMFALPFIATPKNMIQRGLEITPLGLVVDLIDGMRSLRRRVYSGQITKQESQRIAAELYNKSRFVQTLTNQSMGIMIYLAVESLTGGDDDDDKYGRPRITGTMPFTATKKGERDNAQAVMPPQSIRIGNTIIPYGRIEPFATALSAMVDLAESHARNGSYNAQVVTDSIVGLKEQFKDKLFLKGIGDILRVIENPDRGADRLAAGYITGFAPNIIRQPIRELDSEQRDTTPKADVGFFQAVGTRVGYALVPQLAPAKADIWGNPIPSNRGDLLAGSKVADSAFRVVDPFNVRFGGKVDPIDAWIFHYNHAQPDSSQRLGIEAPDDQIVIHVPGETKPRKVALTADEHAESIRNVGQAARAVLDGMDWNWRSASAPDAFQRAETIKDTFTKAKRQETLRLKAKKLMEIQAAEAP